MPTQCYSFICTPAAARMQSCTGIPVSHEATLLKRTAKCWRKKLHRDLRQCCIERQKEEAIWVVSVSVRFLTAAMEGTTACGWLLCLYLTSFAGNQASRCWSALHWIASILYKLVQLEKETATFDSWLPSDQPTLLLPIYYTSLSSTSCERRTLKSCGK